MTTERKRIYGDVPTGNSADELTPPQFMAIGLLLAGRPLADVAREVGIDASTLYRWRKEPAFDAELHAQFDLIREAARYGLYSLAGEAITALRTALRGQNEAARVSAAQTVLDRLSVSYRNPPALASAADDDFEGQLRHLVGTSSQGLDDAEVLRRVRSLLDETS